MAMVFAAEEEISWGQRIFGFATPEFLLPLNYQKEFNVHNLSDRGFDRIYRNGAFLLCLATSAAFFFRKDRLLGIPFPSILLTLGFLVILSHHSGSGLRDLLRFTVFKESGLLLLLLSFALFSRQIKLVIAVVATLALVFALSYVNYHSVVYDQRWPKIQETREYLFGLGCLFYALALAPGRLAAIAPAPLRSLKLPGWRIPWWLMTCSLVIAGSIGLMFFQYFNAMAKTAAIEEAYRSITAGEPVVRSSFDVYLIENELAYVKEPCAPADTEPRFFLHLIPADANDLPAACKRYGFDNLDFHFDRDNGGVRFGGKCLAIRPLPDYKITSIRTGQFIPGEDPIWIGTFTLNR